MNLLRFAMILLLNCAAAAPAAAQTRVSGTDFRTHRARDATLLQAGRATFFISATGGWSYASTSPESGPSRTQNTVFSLPSLGGGYMVTDQIQIRISVNGIFLLADVDGANAQETYGVGGALQALYHLELVQGMALYAGLGAGGFYTSRHVPVGGGLDVGVTGGGFQGQVPIGLLVQPGASLFLRGGIRLDVLVGTESANAPGAGITSLSILDVLTNAELAIGFRI